MGLHRTLRNVLSHINTKTVLLFVAALLFVSSGAGLAHAIHGSDDSTTDIATTQDKIPKQILGTNTADEVDDSVNPDQDPANDAGQANSTDQSHNAQPSNGGTQALPVLSFAPLPDDIYSGPGTELPLTFDQANVNLRWGNSFSDKNVYVTANVANHDLESEVAVHTVDFGGSNYLNVDTYTTPNPGELAVAVSLIAEPLSSGSTQLTVKTAYHQGTITINWEAAVQPAIDIAAQYSGHYVIEDTEYHGVFVYFDIYNFGATTPELNVSYSLTSSQCDPALSTLSDSYIYPNYNHSTLFCAVRKTAPNDGSVSSMPFSATAQIYAYDNNTGALVGSDTQTINISLNYTVLDPPVDPVDPAPIEP